ncbi:MAG: hypothetical protein SGPRY_010738, partial [Prymnesium sp.]
IVREPESAATRAVGLAARAQGYGRATTPAAAAALATVAEAKDLLPAGGVTHVAKKSPPEKSLRQPQSGEQDKKKSRQPEGTWCREGTCTFQHEGKPCYRALWYAGPLPKGKRDNPQVVDSITRAKQENAKRLKKPNVPLLTSTPVQQPADFFTESVSQDDLDGLDHFRLSTGMMADTVGDSTGQLDMELQSPFDPQIDASEDEDVSWDFRQAGAEVGITAATPDVGSRGFRKAPVSRDDSPQPLSYFEVRSLVEGLEPTMPTMPLSQIRPVIERTKLPVSPGTGERTLSGMTRHPSLSTSQAALPRPFLGAPPSVVRLGRSGSSFQNATSIGSVFQGEKGKES